jgi:CDP-paratose 2-epimerase
MNGSLPILITGGAGFIGTNLAHRLAEEGHSVRIYDNLSRPGVERNLAWLQDRHPKSIKIIFGDVRNEELLRHSVRGTQAVFHLAAQVAVTTSLVDPIHDFEVNARGTLNLLEAIRSMKNRPTLLYTSTNKVLGGLESVKLEEGETRYEPEDLDLRGTGISEKWPIDFCSPYGCSKGAADQYVLDYAKTFDLPAVVFRMSCIYGLHQCGNEDQGWVAHFVKQAQAGKPITFYGDGKQVRDALYISDLVDAFLTATRSMEQVRGQAFNIGGGPSNTISLIELVELISKIERRRIPISREAWRPSDQRYYVSDTRRFSSLTGWKPKVDAEAGVRMLCDWMRGQDFESPVSTVYPISDFGEARSA